MAYSVDVGLTPLERYRELAPDALVEELRVRAEALHGLRVLHLSGQAYGGEISEQLRSAVAVLNGVGLEVDWRLIDGDEEYMADVGALRDALAGGRAARYRGLPDHWLETLRSESQEIPLDYDLVVVHDPQLAPLAAFCDDARARWIWRCHLDVSHADPTAWAGIRSFLDEYDVTVFPCPEFAPRDTGIARLDVIPPAIDPLNPRNVALPESSAQQMLEWLGLRPSAPLVTQLAPLDESGDPLGALEAYRIAREEVPDLQLALVGAAPAGDPAAQAIQAAVEAAARAEPMVHVLSDTRSFGLLEVNAFQRSSTVVLQRSSRGVFGLMLAEAMWKRTAIVAERNGGSELLTAGESGRLATDVAECAAAIIEIASDAGRARALGQQARDRVREHFLLPRELLNEIALMAELASGAGARRANGLGCVRRDPVCGMALAADEPAFELTVSGGVEYFCSGACRLRYGEQGAPDRIPAR